MDNKSVKQKFLSNPFSRVILGILVCALTFIIAQNVVGKLIEFTSLNKDFRNLFKGIIASLTVIVAYKIFFRLVEKRKVTELSTKSIAKNLIFGTLIGVVLQSLTILVIYLTSGFEIVSINPISFMIIPFTVAFTVAIFEEILIRGIIFRIMEEKLGSIIALIISAIIFGALHLFNPNSTLMSGTYVAIEGGLLLGAAYIYARNLWLPIAIHFAWNFMQSGVFGAITSGNEKGNGLLTTKLTGPALITGGEFGPEGTIQAILFCSIATIILLYLCKIQNKLIQPYWRNNIMKAIVFKR